MRALLATLWLVVLAASAGADEPPTLVLPEQGEVEVIRLEYEGGFRAPRQYGAPRLAVLANGTARAAEGRETLTITLDPNELMALLRFAVEQHRIFEFDGEAASKKVRERAGQEVPTVEDAADIVITITLKDRRKRASFHALGWMAGQFPQVRALQDLRAIQRRLENLTQVVHAGGRERVAPLLKAANERLKQETPVPPPLAITDLIRTHRWPDGGMDLLFERREGNRTLRVRVDAATSKPLEVSIERLS